MELVVGGFIAGAVMIYTVAKNKMENKETLEKIKEIALFSENILSDKIVFTKENMTGLFNQRYLGKKGSHALHIMISSDQMTIDYYITLSNGKKILLYRYVVDQKIGVGQELSSNKLLTIVEKELIEKMMNKMMNYNFDKPISYYAKETVKFLNPNDKTEIIKKEKEKTLSKEVEGLVDEIEYLNDYLRKDLEIFGNFEEKHNFDRLYNKDFKNLIKAYKSIDEKTEEEEKEMMESLSFIKNKYIEINKKFDKERKAEFKKRQEIMKKRD